MIRLRIKLNTLFILFCAMLWCTPQGMNLMFKQYTSVLNAIRCLIWGFVFGIAIIRRKKFSKFSKLLYVLWLTFLLCIIISDFTVVNVHTWLIPFCSVCGFSLIIELYGMHKAIVVFYKYFYILSIVNLLLLFTMPQGFYFQLTAFDGLSTYDSFSNFISTDNNYAPFLMCFLLFGEMCKERFSKKIYVGMWLIAIITTIRIWSATCLVGFAIYVGLILLRNLKIGIGKITIWKIAVCFFIVFVLIYYFNIQNLFAPIIVRLLGKDLTLTKRVGLWVMAIEMIKKKWLFGWGNLNQGAIILREYYYWYAHNLVLDILLEGGVVTLSAFAFLLYRLAKELRRLASHKLVSCCLRVMIAIMVLSLTESYFNSMYFYIPMIIAVAAAKEARQHQYQVLPEFDQ